MQEEDNEKSIQIEAEENLELKRMLKESQERYENGRGMSTTDLLNSLSKKDFIPHVRLLTPTSKIRVYKEV